MSALPGKVTHPHRLAHAGMNRMILRIFVPDIQFSNTPKPRRNRRNKWFIIWDWGQQFFEEIINMGKAEILARDHQAGSPRGLDGDAMKSG